jgi:hypothetical protein
VAHPPSPGAAEASCIPLPDELLPDELPDELPEELPESDPEEPVPESPGGFPPASVGVPLSSLGPVQHSSLAGPGQ